MTPAGHPQSFQIDSQPAHGTLSALDADAGTVLYTPEAGYRGADAFTYTGSSDRGASVPANVTLFTHQRPVICQPADFDVAYDGALALDLDDELSCAHAERLARAAAPAHGNVTLSGDGRRLIYTPERGYYGPDSFEFTGENQDHSSDATTVELFVLAPAPVCADIDLPDGTVSRARTVALSCFTPPGHTQAFQIDSQPAHGTLTELDPAAGTVLYTPADDYRGADSFDYSARSDRGSGASAQVTMFMHQQPVICNPTSWHLAHGDTPTLSLDDQPSGALRLDCAHADQITILTDPAHGTLTLEADLRSAVYEPDEGFYGTDSFTFTGVNQDHVSAAATITLVVAPPRPVCHDGDTATTPGTALQVRFDCAAVSDAIHVEIVGGPAHGVLTELDPLSGKALYTPARGFNGSDQISFRASQDDRRSDVATLAITVDTPPAPVCDSIHSPATAKLKLKLKLACATTDGFAQTFALTGAPLHGTLGPVDPATGAFSYTADARYSGPDELSLTATNAGGTSAPARVSFDVSLPANTFRFPQVYRARIGISQVTFEFPLRGRLRLALSAPVEGRRRLMAEPVIVRSGPGRRTVAVTLNARARRILSAERKLELTLRVRFRPRGGLPRLKSRSLTVHAPG